MSKISPARLESVNEMKAIFEERTATVSRILKSNKRRQFYPVTIALLEIIVRQANDFDYCFEHHPGQISHGNTYGMSQILGSLNMCANEEVNPVDMTREEYDSLLNARKGLWYTFAIYTDLHFRN